MSAFRSITTSLFRPATLASTLRTPTLQTLSSPTSLRILNQRRHLSDESRNKIDGVRLSIWAPSLSSFIVQFFRRWPHLLSLAGSQVVKENPLVVFMKGTPDLPQCGFSRAVCQILEVQGVAPDKIVAFNCLEDQELREGIKEYSWVHSRRGTWFKRRSVHWSISSLLSPSVSLLFD